MLDTSETKFRATNDDMIALEHTEIALKSDVSTAHSHWSDDMGAFYQSISGFERVAEEMIDKLGRALESHHVETGEPITIDEDIAERKGAPCS
jgi:hypothetical protein